MEVLEKATLLKVPFSSVISAGTDVASEECVESWWEEEKHHHYPGLDGSRSGSMQTLLLLAISETRTVIVTA